MPRTLVLLTSIVVSFLAASSAPTPLYTVYAERWHFTPVTTTVIFAIYALAVLAALLVLGRLSDHLGRRPIILASLGLQAVAMIVFATAGGLGALIAGRILQGVATGGSVGAIGAAMLDVDRRRGVLTNAIAPGLGTALGALLSGLIVQYLPAPTHLIYLLLLAVFAIQAAGVLRMPETVTRRPGAVRALVPEFSVPRSLAGPVLTVAPILFAVWALAGFGGSLAPALVRELSGSPAAALAGVPLFLLTFVGAMTTVAVDRVPARLVLRWGIPLVIAGSLGTLVATTLGSTTGFLVATVVAGAGFGAGIQGAMRTVVPQAAPEERSGVLSVLYVITYLGIGLPSVTAGVFVVHSGLDGTARGYSVFVILLAVATLAGTLRTARRVESVR
ncbi:MFS transporter [Actinoplanes sp. RD1]|uniref:MFS transporter n=1 Tax=Actinoplanes sp. RD1 TaxID=3064538 RepID=UPI0027414A62|nr:MFS transporter [Actinoplanes sp. RD1]